VIEVWQEESSDSGTISDVLDHSLDWLALVALDKVLHVIDVPLAVAHVAGGVGRPLALAGCLGGVFHLEQLGLLGRGSRGVTNSH